MNMKQWCEEWMASSQKKALPLLSFPCVSLMNISVEELLQSSDRMAEGIALVAQRTDSAAAVSMMDLSVEAEAFGCQIRFSPDEVPTVIGALITDPEQADALTVPSMGAGRTALCVEAVEKAVQKINDRPVLAGIIGPFSLAGRLMDVTEALVNCYAEPEMVHTVLEKATEFLIAYALAFRQAGAHGVVMAEPLAGLLSPAMAEEFSEPYVRRIVEAVQTEDFILVYHNCGDNIVSMADSIARVGAAAYHFGNAVSMRQMLDAFPKHLPVLGNVDPAAQFKEGTPQSIREETLRIMGECCADYPNFIISSGCDIPPQTPWENIDAFFAAVKEFAQ